MGKSLRTVGILVVIAAVGAGAAMSLSKTMTVGYEAGDSQNPVALSETTMKANHFILPDGQGLTCIEEEKETRGAGRGCVVTESPADDALTLEEASYSLTYLVVDELTLTCLAYGETRSVTSCFEYAPLS